MEKKAPIYIGVFAENDKESKKHAKQYVLESLKEIHAKYPHPQIQADIANFDATFSFPKDTLHITTLFIGNKPVDKLAQKDKDNYKTFPFGEKHAIETEAIFYVPGYLICGVCHLDIPCANDHPHLTLFISKHAKPVESNDVCSHVFKNNPGLEKEKDIKTQEFVIEGVPEKYHKIYACGRKLKIEGVCRGP